MGSYDYLNGNQVKCFKVPYFYKGDEITKSGCYYTGGKFRKYSNGDYLPLETLFYKYPKNLIIIDHRIDEEMDFIAHLILDGKLENTFYRVSDFNESVFKEDIACINYYGEFLCNIRKAEDIKSFVNTFHKMQKEIAQIYASFSDNQKIYFKALTEFTSKQISEKEYTSIKEDYDKKEAIRDSVINKKNNIFQSLYVVPENKTVSKYKDFGALVSCIIDSSSLYKEQMPKIIDCYKSMVSENPEIIEGYINWANPIDEIKFIIKNINK